MVVGVSGGISNVVSFIWSVLIRHRRYKRYKYRFLRNMVFYGHECSHEIRCGADLFQRSHNGMTDEIQRHDRRSAAEVQPKCNDMTDEVQQHKKRNPGRQTNRRNQKRRSQPPAPCLLRSLQRAQAGAEAGEEKQNRQDRLVTNKEDRGINIIRVVGGLFCRKSAVRWGKKIGRTTFAEGKYRFINVGR